MKNMNFKRVLAIMMALSLLLTGIVLADETEPTVAPASAEVVIEDATPAAETTEEPAAETTEEPVVETTEEPVVETTEEPVAETTEEPVVETTEEPVVETTEEPVVETTEEPVVETTEEPVVETTEEPVVETTEEPVGEFVEGEMMLFAAAACAHNYEMGSCVCTLCEETEHQDVQDDYCYNCGTNLCPHENTWTADDYYEDATFEQYDARDHIIRGDRCEVVGCDDCGDIIEKKVVEAGAENYVGHCWDEEGDTCTDCGYVNTCKHENLETNSWIDSESGSAVANNNRTHTITGTKYEEHYCGDCGKWMNDVTAVEENVTDTEDHWYEDGSNICITCGYENTCKHENVETYDWIECEKGVAVDSRTHTVTGPKYEENRCLDCGRYFNMHVVEENATETQNHWFENGKCGECGYVNTCKHTSVYIDKGVNTDRIVAVDARTHTWQGDQYMVKYCGDCDETLESEFIAKDVTWVQPHYFDNGVCWACDYTNACQHSVVATTKSIEYNKTISKDADGHVVVYDVYEIKLCPKCGETVSSTKIGQEERDEKHNFSYNVCWECGYEDTNPTCEHKNLKEGTYINEGWSTEVEGKDYHLTSGKKQNETYCQDCGRWVKIEYVEWVEDVQEPHRYFQDDNVCFACGHVKSGATAKPTATATPAPTMPAASDEPTATATPAPTMPAASDEPTATAKPTKKPAATATPAPVVTAEPTVAPVVEEKPALEEMKEQEEMHGLRPEDETTMSEAVQVIAEAIEQDGVQQSVSVVNVDKVITVEEKQVLDVLPVKEKILTVLSIMGFDAQVNESLTNSGEELSEQAKALKEQVLNRVAAMNEAEKAEFNAALAESFPTETLVVDGVEYTWFVLEIEIRTGDEVRYERYGFRLEGEEWILTKLYA